MRTIIGTTSCIWCGNPLNLYKGLRYTKHCNTPTKDCKNIDGRIMRRWSGKRDRERENMLSRLKTVKQFALNSLLLKSYEINQEPIKTKNQNNVKRFWSKVYKISNDDHWLWQAALDKHGSGQSWFENKNQGANRVAWKLSFGEIPDNCIVKITCGLKNCVNPNHMSLEKKQGGSKWVGMMPSKEKVQNTEVFIGQMENGLRV